MRKITLKIAIFLFVAVSAFQVEAQTWTKNGWYTVGIPEQDLFLTITGTGALQWSAKLPEAQAAQQEWAIVDHVQPAANGYMQITATIPGAGNFTLATNEENIVVTGQNDNGVDQYQITLIARPGDPVSDTAAENYEFDQFQRRKTSGDVEGNDALFIKPPAATYPGNVRFGVTPVADGPVQFDNGAIDKLEFQFVRDVVLSTKNFDASSLSISNPVNDKLTVKGIDSNITKLSVYNLLGSKVLTKNIAGESSVNLSVSNLVSGMYIVKLEGANGAFSKKIIKQ
jgi:hypothetical protein